MAATLTGVHQPWSVRELDLDGPGPNEVLVQWVASGLCMSDEHMRHGEVRPRFPIIGGHEGAGHVLELGTNVTRVSEGDLVVSSFIPACGHCRWCATGHSNLCDLGASIQTGSLPGGRFVFHSAGEDYGSLGTVATFSQYAVVSEYSIIKIDKTIKPEIAALVACGVPTGWGSAVYAADVEPGDVIAVIGVGGVGINAVQGAAYAGAKYVIGVERVQTKHRIAQQLGASHMVSSVGEMEPLLEELTFGVGADKVIITVDTIKDNLVNQALACVRKGGTLVITTWADPESNTIEISSVELTGLERRIQGSLYGSGNPNREIIKMLDLYKRGHIKLDELITQRYKLGDINEAYDDLKQGKNIRGVVIHA